MNRVTTNNTINAFRSIIAAATLAFLASGISANAYESKSADIVDTAVSAGQFKTLTAALEAAGLVEVLKGDGPFTVFAPTDEAFSKLPEGTVESLLKPENIDQLKAILTYHVVSGEVTSKEVVNLDSAKTVNGEMLEINASAEGMSVNQAKVIKADIMTSNGVIHVIDKVVLPPKS